jgi:hypothetical protein
MVEPILSDHLRARMYGQRSYLTPELIQHAINSFVRKSAQDDGRLQFWAQEPNTDYVVRVVTEPDGRTVITAFRDRNLRP